jgi:hypothetical protein
MKHLSKLAALCVVLVAGALAPVQAALVRVTASGTYTDTTAVSAFSAPGAAWSFSFTVDENPSPIAAYTESGFFTTVPFGDFEFLLGGVATPAALYVAFYNAGNSGGLDVSFTDISDPAAPFNALSFYGPQMYSGDEFAPTMLPGVYVPTGGGGGTGFDVFVDNVLYAQPTANVVITRIPLPGTAVLALLAMVALAGATRQTARHRR